MTAPAIDPGALAAAAEWRLLATLLARPREGWDEEVAKLAGEVRDRALAAAAAAARGATEGPYHALLGPGGAASAREAAHAGFTDPGRLLADLRARYEAFAFLPAAEEPADHLSVECDFLAWLHLKEAYARLRDDAGAAEVTREERRRFLAEHVAVAGRRFVKGLPEGAPAYLRGAAAALAARLPDVAPVPDGPEPDPLAGGCPLGGGCGDG